MAGRVDQIWLVIAALGFSALTVKADSQPDQLMPGDIAVVKPGTLVKIVATPAGPPFELPDASNAPTVNGGTLHLFDTVLRTNGDISFTLPAGPAWHLLGSPTNVKGYQYTGAGTASDPCTTVVIKRTVIKAVCSGPAVSLTLPFQGDLGAILTAGTATKRYCAEFGGTSQGDPTQVLKRTGAPAPASCPSNATPTATPTVTPTPIATATGTPTGTATGTATTTATDTRTPLDTSTSTPVPTATATGTATPTCPPCGITANTCSNGQCQCGTGAACAPGQQCVGGTCVCNATSCPAGCCSGATCQINQLSACGSGGGACATCNATTADTCAAGVCKCGTGPACSPGQQCAAGTCVCNATSCPFGCCSGTTCQVSQFSSCGVTGNSCVACNATTADNCSVGVCKCGSGSACSGGQQCVSGVCN